MGEETQVQNPPQDEDLLEKLLAGAAKREADKKMQELQDKGVVTKAELSTLLKENNAQLIETITSAVAEQIKKAVPPEDAQQTETPENQGGEGQQQAATSVSPGQVQKAGQQVGQRKGTIQGASDPRADNPIRYLIQKGRAGEAYDDLDRALIWGLTEKGFTQGMSYDEIDGLDFGDESAY